MSREDGYAQPTGGSIKDSIPILLSTNITQPTLHLGPTYPSSRPTINSASPEVGLWSNSTPSTSTRASNASCTINVPDASINYWFPPTYSHAIGTMTTKFGNYSNAASYTLVTPTTTFDPASALVSQWACTYTESYVEIFDATWTVCEQYTESPTAATTSVVYRTGGAKPFPPEGSIAKSDARLYNLYTEQPVASHPISIAPNRTVDQVSATPYVHFSNYVIESGNETKTVQLSSAVAYPYGIKGMEHEKSATGPVPDDFLKQVTEEGCEAGQLQAVITVLIVVDYYYINWPDNAQFNIHFESSVLGFEDPPVVVLDNGDDRGTPLTMADFDLPDDPVKPKPTLTQAVARTSYRVGPVPTPAASNNNNNQAAASNQAQAPNVPQPSQITIGSVGTIPIVLGLSSVVVVGSQTLLPGQPAVIVGGVTPVSLVPSATAIVVGGFTTIRLPRVFPDPAQQPARPPPILSIGSSTFTPNAATQFSIAPSQILTPGGTATLDGTLISLAPSASFVVVGGNTQILPAAPATPNAPQIVVGGSTITALPPQAGIGSPNSNNQNGIQNNPANNGIGPLFVVGSQLLVPGGQDITVSGTTLSLIPGGSSLVINGVTSAVTTPPLSPARQIIPVGDDVFTPLDGSGSTFVGGGQTLVPGGQAITVSGRVISLAPSASLVVVDGVTSTLVNVAAAAQTTPPVLSIGNGIFRPLPGSGTSYLIGSSTLTPGGVVVVAGTTISLAQGATALVVNGQTSIVSPSVTPIITNAPLLTIGSQTYTAISGTTFVIGEQTLTPGGTITVSGTTISLAPGATQLVYGSSGRSTTTVLFPATTTNDSSMNGTASPSAGASGRNGQAAATSSRQGSGSTINVDGLVFSFVVIALRFLLG